MFPRIIQLWVKCKDEFHIEEQSKFQILLSCWLTNKFVFQLREYAKYLADMVAEEVDSAKIQAKVEEFMGHIYRFIGICLGIPPKTFTWEYYDKSKQYCVVENIQPIDFYETMVKPLYNVENKVRSIRYCLCKSLTEILLHYQVCLVSDPRPKNPYGSGYTVDCLGNMVGGRPTFYNNQPIELLAQFAAQSIENNEAVWLGCEVSKRFAAKQGLEDLEMYSVLITSTWILME